MNAEKKVTSVILAGVGGQGVLLAAKVLSEVAARSGLSVKSSEVHGMAQRGGSVLAQVRFGKTVYSPLTPLGGADYLVALEELKALRYRLLLRRSGLIILQLARILPASVTAGQTDYPDGIERTLGEEGYRVLPVARAAIIDHLGDPRFVNICCLGVLSSRLHFTLPAWKQVIFERIRPAFRKRNWEAFELGRTI